MKTSVLGQKLGKIQFLSNNTYFDLAITKACQFFAKLLLFCPKYVEQFLGNDQNAKKKRVKSDLGGINPSCLEAILFLRIPKYF